MPTMMKPTTGIQEPRTITGEFRSVEGNSNQIEISFSSEYAVRRWFGDEILLHEENAVDFNRLMAVGSLLFNHGKDVKYGKMPVGRIEKAWLDTEQHKARALIIFDDDEDSQRVKDKVLSKSIRGVSCRYDVDSWEEVMPGKQSSNGRFTGPAYIALRWEPFEISIEPVPADPSVGPGREMESPKVVPPVGETQTETQRAVQAERQRLSDITALCRDFEVDPQPHITSGDTVDQVRAALIEKLKPQRGSDPTVTITADETDKFRDAAVDAILSRGGIKVQDPAPGYRDLMGVRLTGFASECLIKKGVYHPHRLDDDILLREALSPDSQFGSILSSAASKAMAVSYKAAGTTFQKWTRRGSNPDFKATMQYQISEAGDLLPVTQSGEFKFDEVRDQGVRKVVATFGRGWGLTRQAIINDDIGALTKTPAAYARAAARGINRLVYMQLGANPVIYDGVQLFNAAHGNVAAGAGAINVANVGAGKAAMRQQRGLRGLEALNIGPKFLIVPAARETVAQQYISKKLIPTTQGAINPLANILEPVVDAELDPYSLTAWYLAADPLEADTIEVTYLNEKDLPTIESQVGFDYLGVKWRIFIDYGVTVLDYRGLYMDAGI